jgi:WD40 repeat protein
MLAVVVAIGTLGIVALTTRQPGTRANLAGAITPPAAGPGAGQTIPLAAGTRFVFLRAGALWSTLADGSNQRPERLTPPGVTVADGWVISPTMPGHMAGNMLAYIDIQSGTIHTIRSDGQQDTAISRVLPKTLNASVWESAAGQTILKSMIWSRDSNVLAFVSDPTGSGQNNLSLYFAETGRVQKVSSDLPGSVTRIAWSPDGTRLAFTLAHNGIVSVLDYNTRDRATLDLSNLAASKGEGGDSALVLGWSPNTTNPAVTWSLGSIGQIHSLWMHRVGASGTLYPQLLLSGNFLQAIYSPNGENGAGSWLLVETVAGRAGDIWRLDLRPGVGARALSRGKQISFAEWSPDGSTIFYLDGQSNAVGNGYLVNAATGTSYLLSTHLATSPAPAWSSDGQQMAYSQQNKIIIANTLNGSQVLQLKLHGRATNLTWSPAISHQLVVSLADTTPGIYLVDTVHNSSLQLDHLSVDSSIQWSEIP